MVAECSVTRDEPEKRGQWRYEGNDSMRLIGTVHSSLYTSVNVGISSARRKEPRSFSPKNYVEERCIERTLYGVLTRMVSSRTPIRSRLSLYGLYRPGCHIPVSAWVWFHDCIYVSFVGALEVVWFECKDLL